MKFFSKILVFFVMISFIHSGESFAIKSLRDEKSRGLTVKRRPLAIHRKSIGIGHKKTQIIRTRQVDEIKVLRARSNMSIKRAFNGRAIQVPERVKTLAKPTTKVQVPTRRSAIQVPERAKTSTKPTAKVQVPTRRLAVQVPERGKTLTKSIAKAQVPVRRSAIQVPERAKTSTKPTAKVQVPTRRPLGIEKQKTITKKAQPQQKVRIPNFNVPEKNGQWQARYQLSDGTIVTRELDNITFINGGLRASAQEHHYRKGCVINGRRFEHDIHLSLNQTQAELQREILKYDKIISVVALP